jgi:PAS domain S-box-containing protein
MYEHMFASPVRPRKRWIVVLPARKLWLAMRGHSMFDSRTKARSLAFLFSASALVSLMTIVLPQNGPTTASTVIATAVFSLVMALVLMRCERRITEPLLHAALATVTIVLSLDVHYTQQAGLYPLVYMWPALYAFFFFSTSRAIAHLAFIGVAYGTVLATENTMDATIRLVLVLGTPLVVGLLIARVLGFLRAGLERSAQQERALRSSERQTRLIIDSARDGFISTDAEGRVLDINAAAERLLGRPREDVLGRPFQELGIPRHAHAKFDERRRALLAGGREDGLRHLERRVTIDRPDGSRLYGETMIWVVERDGEWMFNARLTDIGDRLRDEEERERRVRAEAERAEAERATATIGRLQAVADAALTHRDLDALLPAILARTRDVMGTEAAALLLLQEDGTLAIISSDPVTREDRPRRVPADAGIAGRVLANGAPVLLDDPSPEELADPTILEAGISSMLGVPLVAHGETIGVIEIGARKPRRLGSEDVNLLRLTADRVALAIDHARAFGREHRIAETLQRSLLPQTLPDLPGVALAARYLPAASEAEVGGDWYDAIALTGGRALLVLGDVSGKGLAAASMLGALRNAIRAYALEGHGPAEIAERLNEFILAEPVREHMATLVLAVFDPVDATLSWVNAGHPSPLVLGADGSAHLLEGGRSVPLGVLPFPGYQPATATLEPGGAIVLYTDGLIERRGEHLDEGLQLILRAAADGPLDADAICERLLATALPTGASTDDVALLALCHAPLGTRLTLDMPSEPIALRSMRALLRRWLAQADAPDVDVHAIVMACSEACTNAIEHAGAGPGETIAFEAVLHDGQVDVTVRDRGHWRDQRPPSDQGRGLDLIDALMDEVRLETTTEGTVVRLRRRLSAPIRV